MFTASSVTIDALSRMPGAYPAPQKKANAVEIEKRLAGIREQIKNFENRKSELRRQKISVESMLAASQAAKKNHLDSHQRAEGNLSSPLHRKIISKLTPLIKSTLFKDLTIAQLTLINTEIKRIEENIEKRQHVLDKWIAGSSSVSASSISPAAALNQLNQLA